MYSAGRDTTAQALSWTIFRLDSHHHIAKKMRDEISTVFGDHPDFFASESPLTYETVKEMSYMHATFSEVLRLHPSVPKQGRTALQDDILPDGTHVPAGCL